MTFDDVAGRILASPMKIGDSGSSYIARRTGLAIRAFDILMRSETAKASSWSCTS